MDFDYDSLTFEIVDISVRATKASIYISGGKVSFNKKAIEELHYTDYAQYCINTEYKVLAVKECREDDFKAMKFGKKYTDKGNIMFSSKIVQSVVALLISDFDIAKKYVVIGEYDPEKRIMYFNFQNVQCIEGSFRNINAEATFYKVSDDMLEELNEIEEEIRDCKEEDAVDYVKEENENNTKYEVVYQNTIPWKSVDRQSNGRSIRWRPLNVKVYINGEIYGEFEEPEFVVAHNNDKIKIVPSKHVVWRGLAVNNIDVVSQEYTGAEFIVHRGRIGISYFSKYSIDINGEREKGRIQFIVD